MSDIIEILRQYRSEWENVCPDAVMKKNLRDRMFALLDRRTPAPSPLEAARSALMEIEADCLKLSRLPLVEEGESRTWRAIRNKIIAVRSALSGPAKGGAKI